MRIRECLPRSEMYPIDRLINSKNSSPEPTQIAETWWVWCSLHEVLQGTSSRILKDDMIFVLECRLNWVAKLYKSVPQGKCLYRLLPANSMFVSTLLLIGIGTYKAPEILRFWR